MKNLLFIAIVSCVAIASCGKKGNLNGKMGNRYEILTSRNWQIVSKTATGYAGMKACETDNYYVFQTNGLGRWEEGANNCYETGIGPGPNPNPGTDTTNNGDSTSIITNPIPTYTEFSWSLTGDHMFIYMKNFGRQGYDPEWSIENMDYTSMTVKQTEKINGQTIVYQIELRAL